MVDAARHQLPAVDLQRAVAHRPSQPTSLLTAAVVASICPDWEGERMINPRINRQTNPNRQTAAVVAYSAAENSQVLDLAVATKQPIKPRQLLIRLDRRQRLHRVDQRRAGQPAVLRPVLPGVVLVAVHLLVQPVQPPVGLNPPPSLPLNRLAADSSVVSPADSAVQHKQPLNRVVRPAANLPLRRARQALAAIGLRPSWIRAARSLSSANFPAITSWTSGALRC